MPTTYAHQYFGSKVRAQLSHELRTRIEPYENLYDLGLQGPDLLFYYRPFQKNPVSKKGHEIHQQPARLFFEAACNALPRVEDQEAASVYLLGFLCHFLLDSACHPLVNQVEEERKVQHNTIEKELDRMLMLKDGKDPLRYYPGSVLHLEAGDEAVIAAFYPEITAGQIRYACRSMKRILYAIVTPGLFQYRMTLLLIRSLGKEKSFGSLLMARIPVPACKESSAVLVSRLEESVLPAADLVEEWYQILTETRRTGGLDDPFWGHSRLAERLASNFG